MHNLPVQKLNCTPSVPKCKIVFDTKNDLTFWSSRHGKSSQNPRTAHIANFSQKPFVISVCVSCFHMPAWRLLVVPSLPIILLWFPIVFLWLNKVDDWISFQTLGSYNLNQFSSWFQLGFARLGIKLKFVNIYISIFLINLHNSLILHLRFWSNTECPASFCADGRHAELSVTTTWNKQHRVVQLHMLPSSPSNQWIIGSFDASDDKHHITCAVLVSILPANWHSLCITLCTLCLTRDKHHLLGSSNSCPRKGNQAAYKLQCTLTHHLHSHKHQQQ